jgi:CRISPR-associated protein (TIGR02584 family)
VSSMPPDPARPETYPHRILLAVTGLSPQVVTETLYALAVDRATPFVPTEVHVISTAEGAERVRLELLHRSTGHFKALCREYGLKGIRFDERCIHTIQDADGSPLDDIQTKQQNTLAADGITSLVREFTKDAKQTALHVSIAGGRKTMGFYLGYALSLFGRAQDRLSHVLVSPQFESNKAFFYPPKGSDVIRGQNDDPLDTKDARITLAEIPFVRMRNAILTDVQKGEVSFSASVEAVQNNLEPPGLHIDLLASTVLCAGSPVKLAKKDIAFYAWLAEQAAYGEPDDAKVSAKTHSPVRFVALYDIVGQDMRSRIAENYQWAVDGGRGSPLKQQFWQKEIQEASSRINRALKKGLGYLAEQYLIKAEWAEGRAYRRYWLDLVPEQIRITDGS